MYPVGWRVISGSRKRPFDRRVTPSTRGVVLSTVVSEGYHPKTVLLGCALGKGFHGQGGGSGCIRVGPGVWGVRRGVGVGGDVPHLPVCYLYLTRCPDIGGWIEVMLNPRRHLHPLGSPLLHIYSKATFYPTATPIGERNIQKMLLIEK